MKVTLAGFNIDKNLIDKLPTGTIATPETISAAYARISRDPRDVDKLREESLLQVKKARKSNQAIVFGMSHHSVAEHAYFNFDILQISRLALEELEARRIGAAYTEKSQRYITLKGDFVVPSEFSEADVVKFKELVELQNKFYENNLGKLTKYQFENNPELAEDAAISKNKGTSDKMNRAQNTLEGWAKEDARYALSLATQAQLGMSFNARTLEHAIRILRHSKLAECRELSQKLFNVTKNVAPSLIILTDPNEFKKAFKTELQDDYFELTKSHLEKYVADLSEKYLAKSVEKLPIILESEHEKLIQSENVDLDIAVAILHHNSKLSVEDAYRLASFILAKKKGKDFFAKCLKHISAFDSVPREFEFCGNLKFEIVVSSSNFAQLKRHRLMTILAQDYDPNLGITIPASIKAIGAEKELVEICQKSEKLYFEFLSKYGKVAEYCLTNAHRRRVLIASNPRELYHLSRLREDEHAQWDIKETAARMLNLAKKIAPHSFIFSGGKNEFEKIKRLK
ncbi:MAG: FAD-dependent thymidylate synthase [Candidatus Cloacimonetes bacterium]|jgi:flavin-dependent thymidylate synthase|nr:FAD-dependent thymidylate synthase [Candidatus Cloacimonadota bacterium]MBT6994929.1 FAD-dependent thymidylate synthase [Candidatus Cloacimonadota bacterium]MBT7469057.1 FAD-dependent thymidylate synthase [Candidatus Cloacimonadota bacterium]